MNTAPKLQHIEVLRQMQADFAACKGLTEEVVALDYAISAMQHAALAPPSGEGVDEVWWREPPPGMRFLSDVEVRVDGINTHGWAREMITTPQSAPVDHDPLLSAAEQFVAACNDGNADTLLDYFADIFGEAIAALSAQAIVLAEIVGPNDPMPKDWCTLAVGNGSGRLFVHGHYDAIKACQAALLARNKTTTTPPASQERGDVDEFLADVRAELIRARAKFPGDRIMTIALAEEFGELCKAILDEPSANVRKEAVQTAVMAARVALDGDGSVNDWRKERGLDELIKGEG